MEVCSTEFVFHTLLNPEFDRIEEILQNGLRPLSDFPQSERWQQIEQAMPGFYRNLYEQLAQPILQKPYTNSGIFLSPIDFWQLPGTLLHGKPRIRIPISRLDPNDSVLTYVLHEQRVLLPLNSESLAETARLWTEEKVREWFAKDANRMFFYVPQMVNSRSESQCVHSPERFARYNQFDSRYN